MPHSQTASTDPARQRMSAKSDGAEEAPSTLAPLRARQPAQTALQFPSKASLFYSLLPREILRMKTLVSSKGNPIFCDAGNQKLTSFGGN